MIEQRVIDAIAKSEDLAPVVATGLAADACLNAEIREERRRNDPRRQRLILITYLLEREERDGACT
jgi:hypothetical protein